MVAAGVGESCRGCRSLGLDRAAVGRGCWLVVTGVGEGGWGWERAWRWWRLWWLAVMVEVGVRFERCRGVKR